MRDLTLGEIKNMLKPNAWKKFQEWFHGQTGEINDKGEMVVYGYDFQRFLDTGEDYLKEEESEQ